MESVINTLASELLWKPCAVGDKSCQLGNFKSYETIMMAPSAYTGPFVDIKIYVQKISFFSEIPSNVHMIFLAGGPGSKGRSYDTEMKTFLSGLSVPVTCYLVEHRGVGRSTRFTDEKHPNLWNRLDSVLRNNMPFPLKDLNMSNAAYDVGLFAASIQKSEGWKSGSKIVLYGASYGGQWAHHIVELLPNTFDQAFILSAPALPNLGVKDTHSGILESCEQDSFCSSKMGPNVEESIRQALLSISNKNYNECTKDFSGIWMNEYESLPQGEKVIAIAVHMLDLIKGSSGLNHHSDLYTVQLVFAAIKATADCKAPATYRKDVLEPLLPYMDQVITASQTGAGDDVNHFVNAVVNIQKDYNFEATPESHVQNHTDLSLAHVYESYYRNAWTHLRPYMQGYTHTIEKPVNTTKTHLHVAHGRMDMVCTHTPAYARFRHANAPVKSWILFNHREHDGLTGDCLYLWVDSALTGQGMGRVRRCMDRINRNEFAQDWAFKEYPQFANIWNQVQPLQEASPGTLTGSTPAFAYINPDQKIDIWEFDFTILGIAILAFLVVIIGLFCYIRGGKRKQAKEAEIININ